MLFEADFLIESFVADVANVIPFDGVYLFVQTEVSPRFEGFAALDAREGSLDSVGLQVTLEQVFLDEAFVAVLATVVLELIVGEKVETKVFLEPKLFVTYRASMWLIARVEQHMFDEVSLSRETIMTLAASVRLAV